MKLSGRFMMLRRSIIFVLAGLLIFHHTYTLCQLYLGSGSDLYEVGSEGTHSAYEIVQSILRVFIVVSLLLVIAAKRTALYAMWVSIGSLVASHYWAVYFDLPFRFLEGRTPLSFLKGFIFPTVITLLFPPKKSDPGPGKDA